MGNSFSFFCHCAVLIGEADHVTSCSLLCPQGFLYYVLRYFEYFCQNEKRAFLATGRQERGRGLDVLIMSVWRLIQATWELESQRFTHRN